MLSTCWISLFGFFHFGIGLGQHARHERTRYVSGRNQIHGLADPDNYIPFVHFWERPLQMLESSMNVPKRLFSRPLFSWDTPVQMSTYSTTDTKTSTEHSIESLGDAPSSPQVRKAPDGVAPQKTRADRLHRDRTPYGSLRKKKKVNNRKFTIDDPTRTLRWRQNDSQNPEKEDFEVKRLKKKKKGKKNKKDKAEKQTEIGKGTVVAVEKMTNDGANEVNPKKKIEYYQEGMRVEKILKEKQREEQTKKKTKGKAVDKSKCEAMEGKCEHKCQEIKGEAVCVCFRGFKLVGNKCEDVDECETDDGGCNGRCLNTLGSRRCICSSGFRLVGGICVDVNECILRNGHGPCQDRCSNTMGSYTCSCEGLPGTTLSSDRHTCENTNECALSSTGCSHSCVNVSGRVFCTCPDGLELGEDWKTCHDVDECSSPEDHGVECPKSCENTVGSYRCSNSGRSA